jgi:GTPase SAR1 family protein
MEKLYTFAVVGNKGVGKTSLIEDCAVEGICNIHTNEGDKQVILLESPPIDRKIDGVLIVFDVRNKKSFEDFPKWYKMYKDVTDNFFLCGNKTEIARGREVRWKEINKRPIKIGYCDISSASGYNIEKPYVELLKKWYPKLELPRFSPPSVLDFDWKNARKEMCTAVDS